MDNIDLTNMYSVFHWVILNLLMCLSSWSIRSAIFIDLCENMANVWHLPSRLDVCSSSSKSCKCWTLIIWNSLMSTWSIEEKKRILTDNWWTKQEEETKTFFKHLHTQKYENQVDNIYGSWWCLEKPRDEYIEKILFNLQYWLFLW